MVILYAGLIVDSIILGNRFIVTVINNKAEVNAEDKNALKNTPFSNNLRVFIMVKIVSNGIIKR